MGFSALEADVQASAERVGAVFADRGFQRSLLGSRTQHAPLSDNGAVIWGPRGIATCRVTALTPDMSRVRIGLHRRVPLLALPLAALLAPARARVSRQISALAEEVGAPAPVARPEPVP